MLARRDPILKFSVHPSVNVDLIIQSVTERCVDAQESDAFSVISDRTCEE